MRHLVRLLVFGSLLISPARDICAQIYHDYRPTSQTVASDTPSHKSRPWLEIQDHALASFGAVKDADNSEITRRMTGWRATALLPLSSVFAVGAQVEKLKAHDMATSMITPIKRDSWAALLRITLTPNTEPQLYLLLGAGQAKYKSKFPLQTHTLDGSTPLLLLGAGIDIKIWKGLHVLGEYQLQAETRRWKNFVLTGPDTRSELSAAVSWRF